MPCGFSCCAAEGGEAILLALGQFLLTRPYKVIVKHTQNCTKRLEIGTISVSGITVIGCSSITIFCFINFVNFAAGRGVELVLTGGSSELSGPRRVSFEELNAATKNFSSINLIGHGTFGEVYKGLLHDGTVVAIKRRPSAPNEAFVQEVFTYFFFVQQEWHVNHNY